MAQRKRVRRAQGSGTIRRLPSGMYQARVRAADGSLRPAPHTFASRIEAADWLAGVSAERLAPGDRPVADYARDWLVARDVAPSTKADYRRLLDQQILPTLGMQRMSRVTPAMVRAWFDGLDPAKPALRSAAYNVLHALFARAYEDDVISNNPCRISGAGTVAPAHRTAIATLEELEVIVAEMPDRLRLLVLLAAWCGLRFGELTELRRLDVVGDVITIRRGVTWVDGVYLVGEPKSRAGVRDVTMPPHLLPVMREHLARHVAPGPDALLFPSMTDPGRHLANSTMQRHYFPAREKAGRPDLHFHDLRHTGATLAAAAGASLAELMGRIGHASPRLALHYQHVAAGRDRLIAEALSRFADAGSLPLVGTASA